MPSPLLDLLRGRGLEPRHVAATNGGEYACPCPGCGGKDRFRAHPEAEGGHETAKASVLGTWFCRGCGKRGDVVEFLRAFCGMTWAQAWEHLRLKAPATIQDRLPSSPKAKQRPTFAPKTLATPAELWQAKAAELVDRAHAALLERPEDLAWLAARGLPLEAVRAYRLGWLEGEDGRQGVFRDRAAWGLEPKTVKGKDGQEKVKRSLFIPRGIVIPAFGPTGEVLRLRIRRTNEDVAAWGDKYMVVVGSGMAPLFLGLEPRAVVVVEAELDALAVHHAAGDLVGSLAVLTSLGRPDAATHQVLARALSILVALDSDEAGAGGWFGPKPENVGKDGWRGWKHAYAQAKRWPVPSGKDPGDAVAAGLDLREWVLAGLPPVMTMTLGPSRELAVDSSEGGAPQEPVQAEAMQASGAEIQAAAAAPGLHERLAELQGLLLKTGMVIDRRKGMALTHPRGELHRIDRVPWETFGRISDLVFLDHEISSFVTNHQAPVVTGGNLLAKRG